MPCLTAIKESADLGRGRNCWLLCGVCSELSRVQIFSCLDYEDVTVRTLQRVGALFYFVEKNVIA